MTPPITTCPNCGGTNFDEEGDCSSCLEPGVQDGNEAEAEESSSEAFDALADVVGEWITERGINWADAADMLANLASRIREG